MMRYLVMVVAMLLTTFASPAEARRAALVIGNSAYTHATLLPNPAADSRLIADAARQAGFDVTLVTDQSRGGFVEALRNFRTQADGAEVAMIYYAGHGIESQGNNWLIPVDAELRESRDLTFEAVNVDALLETLGGATLKLVVLDACRNNPFGKNWRSGARSVDNGLVERQVEGALVIFAAAGGQVATDGVGANSPFAMSLARRLPEPNLSIHRLGSVVREDVMSATGGSQSPWVNMSIDGREFFLVGTPGSAAPAPASGSGDVQGMADMNAWVVADAENTVESYTDYVTQFPNGRLARTAQRRIDAMRGPGNAKPAPAPAAVVTQPVSAPVLGPAAKPTAPQVVATRPAPATPVSGPVVTGSVVGGKPMPVDGGDPGSVAIITANANKVNDRAPLPRMPLTPRFPGDGYPVCREEFQAQVDPIQRVVKINECLSALTGYFESTINGFARSMVQHQQAISGLYTQQVAGNDQYSPESQQKFYRDMMAEHSASNPDGANFADYRGAKERYEKDREYLQDRYCANTGSCGGYPVPAGIAPSAK